MQVKTQVDELQNYLTDASNMKGGSASRLYVPENEADIAAILAEANRTETPVTISGARTGTVGGAVPFGGVIVSLEKLNKVVKIDRERYTAVCEPGVILADFQKAVDAEGLFYPPDPTEWSCQIGGTVATNASGARSFKYGATRKYVKRLRVVLADGSVLELIRGETLADDGGVITLQTTDGRNVEAKIPTYERPNVRKNVSGYFCTHGVDAIDLFIGSEGTLGVITEVELSVLPKSDGFFSGIVFFEKESDLLAFVAAARDKSFSNRERFTKMFKFDSFSGFKSRSCMPELDVDSMAESFFDATLLEYFDSRSLTFISNKFPETPKGMAGAIFFEQETYSKTEDILLEKWNQILEKHNADLDKSWFTTNDQDREKMREFRHALPVSVNEFIARHKQRKVGTDMAVPDEKFTGFLRFYRETLDASGLDYVIFGHIGDCHLHANILPKDDAEAEKARHLYGRFIAHAIVLGGTVSAEHGIGKLKSKYLNAMMGERYLNEMAALKRAFDPNGILGRGNILETKFLQ